MDCVHYRPSFQSLDCGGQWVKKEDWGCDAEDDLPEEFDVCGESCKLYEEDGGDPRCDDRDDD